MQARFKRALPRCGPESRNSRSAVNGAENRDNEPKTTGANLSENAASWGPHPKVRAPAAKYASLPWSGRNDVLGGRTLLPLSDVERHLLAFLQLAEALGGDVRVVGEDVGAAAVLLDEAEALFGVEPLHSAGNHVISPSETVLGVHLVRTPCRRDDESVG